MSVCTKHKIKMVRRFNSTIFICPKCAYESVKCKNVKKSTNNPKSKAPKSRAMELADLWFSRYIRIKYHYKVIGGEVYCRCIVSGTIKNANRMDNGHCFSREFKPTRYEEDNCRPQNRSSNRYRGEADHYKFIDNLKLEIGEERFNRIDALRRETGDDNETYYREVASEYHTKVNKLLKQLEIKKWW